MIKRSGYFGSLNWEGGNYRYALLTDLPSHITVNKGDTIITSGYSSMFPKGEIIGWVETVNEVKSSDLLSLRIRLAVDFKNISHVMVIKNLLRNEQLKLETESSHD
jgi:rod shape-determining protein MreC